MLLVFDCLRILFVRFMHILLCLQCKWNRQKKLKENEWLRALWPCYYPMKQTTTTKNNNKTRTILLPLGLHVRLLISTAMIVSWMLTFPLLHRKAYSYTVPSFKNNTTQNAKIYHHKVDNWCEYLSGVAVLKLSVKGRVGYFQHWVTSGNDCLQLNLFTIFEYENLAKLTMGKYFSFDIC